MRKGFTLTLTTLAVALMTASVYAYGPTVGGIPDVWITENDAAGVLDGPQYMFRYSDAIVLADYVTPGVQEGNGSSSTTLEWTWALKYSTFDGGFSIVTGAAGWLDGTDVHYSIEGEDATDVASNKPTFDIDGNSFSPSTWVAEVNTWSGKANLADSGALTFRNIRLNGSIDTGNPSPTADTSNPQLPSGVLDLQEATIFVTDGATTPGFDMVQLITLMSGPLADRDRVSGGGPSYSIVEDYRTSTPSSEWTLINIGLNVSGTVDGAAGATSAVNNQAGTLTATFPTVNTKGSNPSDPLFPAVLFQKSGVAVTSSNIYRITARVASSNTDKTLNPSVRADLNGRTTVGEGFGEVSANPAAASVTTAPVSGSPVYVKGFLWPAANGSVQSFIVMWDTTDLVGGTLTLDNMLVEAFDPTALVGGTVLYDVGTEDGTPGISGFSNGAIQFLGTTAPNITFVQSPASGDADYLQITGVSGVDGAGFWADFDGNFATPAFTGKKLVIVKAMVRTTSAETADVPDFHMAVNNIATVSPLVRGNERAGVLVNREFSGATKTNDDSDVTTTARPYYVIFEAKPSTTYGLELYGLVTGAGINGNLIIDRLTATMYELPVETTSQP